MPRLRTAIKTLALLFLMFCLFAALTFSRHDIFDFSGPTMGTRYSVRITKWVGFFDRGIDLNAIQEQVDERLAAINRMMSTYDPQSELSRFNAAPAGEWFAVSPESAKVVAFSLEIAQKTDGAFDPTIGPVVNLWGFGPRKSRRVPTEDEITAALPNVGYRQIEVRTTPPALRKNNPNVYVDLSAIAKGFAADEISQLLAELGFAHSMVEIGGEIHTRGTRPDGTAWRIGVENPSPDGRATHKVVELRNESLASSGDYRNFFEHEGVRYSHTIDPQTGRPVTHQVATVSVRTASCMEADALATALLVMGDAAGYDWCQEHGIAALFLVRAGDEIVEKATTKFSELDETLAPVAR